MPVDYRGLGIDRLSVGERLELIEVIWNGLPDQVAPQDLPDWHLAELARRREQAESQPGAGQPWRDVLPPLNRTD